MPRPPRRRWIGAMPQVTYYKPRGVPLRTLDEVVLGLDELEALRLADLEGLSQEEAGERMNVSRATFGRIVETARRKTAGALTHGMALRIEGGSVVMNQQAGVRTFVCRDCGHRWTVPFGGGPVGACPACGGPNAVRDDAPGGAAGRGAGRGRGGRGRGGRGRGGGRGRA